MSNPEKLILQNRLSPGDVLMSTTALRDLHLSYPGEFITDYRSPCQEVFYNNRYITPLAESEGRLIDLQYPLIHESGYSGRHFSEGYRDFLADQIGKPIKNHGMKPEIYLNPDELNWPNPLALEHGYEGPYWIINAGVKNDYTLKKYPFYQEVVDALKGKVQFVQVGQLEHDHPPLLNVFDMRGKTTLRQLFRLSHYSDGAVCAVSLQMVVQAAFAKPCVVINGGREPIRWQHYPNHRFLAVNGTMSCCSWDGCWKSKRPGEGTVDQQCVNWDYKQQAAKCMTMIKPYEVARAVEMYYDGGLLAQQEILLVGV